MPRLIAIVLIFNVLAVVFGFLLKGWLSFFDTELGIWDNLMRSGLVLLGIFLLFAASQKKLLPWMLPKIEEAQRGPFVGYLSLVFFVYVYAAANVFFYNLYGKEVKVCDSLAALQDCYEREFFVELHDYSIDTSKSAMLVEPVMTMQENDQGNMEEKEDDARLYTAALMQDKSAAAIPTFYIDFRRSYTYMEQESQVPASLKTEILTKAFNAHQHTHYFLTGDNTHVKHHKMVAEKAAQQHFGSPKAMFLLPLDYNPHTWQRFSKVLLVLSIVMFNLFLGWKLWVP